MAGILDITDEQTRGAIYPSLMAAAFAMLANRDKSSAEALGYGGLAGIGAYQAMLNQLQERKVRELQAQSAQQGLTKGELEIAALKRAQQVRELTAKTLAGAASGAPAMPEQQEPSVVQKPVSQMDPLTQHVFAQRQAQQGQASNAPANLFDWNVNRLNGMSQALIQAGVRSGAPELIAQGVEMGKQAKELYAARPQVKEIKPMKVNGELVNVMIMNDGSSLVMSQYGVKPEYQMKDFGGFQQLWDMNSGKPVGKRMPKTATPGEALTHSREVARMADEGVQYPGLGLPGLSGGAVAAPRGAGGATLPTPPAGSAPAPYSAATAAAFGMPPPAQPAAPQTTLSPKAQRELGLARSKAMVEASAKVLEDYDKKAGSAIPQMTAIDDALGAFVNYYKTSPGGTGPIAGRIKGSWNSPDTEALDAKFQRMSMRDLVATFAGMSKAIDSNAEREAWNKTQPDVTKNDITNAQILVGAKAIMVKTRLYSEELRAHIAKGGNLGNFESSVMNKTVVFDAEGNTHLIDKKMKGDAIAAGYYDPDQYARLIIGQPQPGQRVTNSRQLMNTQMVPSKPKSGTAVQFDFSGNPTGY